LGCPVSCFSSAKVENDVKGWKERVGFPTAESCLCWPPLLIALHLHKT
jgi:hypothetical protein